MSVIFDSLHRSEMHAPVHSKSARVGWEPSRFVRQIASLSRDSFVERYSSEAFLLVNLRSADLGLLQALRALFDPPDDGEEDSITQENPGSPAFRTATDMREAEALIPASLTDEPHFVLPLRRSSEALVDTGLISVGRSTDADIILKHRSVSKLHAWFEYDPVKGVLIRDAGSKNGTRVNGERLSGDDAALVSGDTLSFGTVECVICDPQALWRIVTSL